VEALPVVEVPIAGAHTAVALIVAEAPIAGAHTVVPAAEEDRIRKSPITENLCFATEIFLI
jgi:hypothetical protein